MRRHLGARPAAELSDRHVNDRYLPDKAIDVIDEAGAAARLKNKKTIRPKDIEKVVSAMARVPVRQGRLLDLGAGGGREAIALHRAMITGTVDLDSSSR